MHIVVRHFHNGNDPDHSKRKEILTHALRHVPKQSRKYVTVAKAYSDDDELIASEVAVCSPLDQPNRRRGYDVAVGRLTRRLKVVI